MAAVDYATCFSSPGFFGIGSASSVLGPRELPNADLSRSESGVSGEKDRYGDMTQAKIKLKKCLGAGIPNGGSQRSQRGRRGEPRCWKLDPGLQELLKRR